MRFVPPLPSSRGSLQSYSMVPHFQPILAVMDLNPLMWTCLILVAVLGPIFTLWWWKMGDKWADAEHRRFQDKPDTRDKVVMKSTPPDGRDKSPRGE